MTTYDPVHQAVADAYDIFHGHGHADIVELRAPKARSGDRLATLGGHFESGAQCAHGANALTLRAPGVYWPINPVKTEVARARNRVTFLPQATSDADILRRVWLPIDIDPERPTGTSSTEAEHAAALEAAAKIELTLMAEHGWPQGVLVDSGNGAHVYFRIDLPNDKDATALVNSVLHALAGRFNNEAIKVDTIVGNAARIMRVPGTWARKGEGTHERPHRQSRLLRVPDTIAIVPAEALQLVAETAPIAEPVRPVPQAARNSPRGYPEQDFQSAIEAYNRDRTPEYPGPGKGQCPACGHRDCFGHLPDDRAHWYCFSSGHDKPGTRGANGYHGDALDLDAHLAGMSLRAHLLREGYLAGRPVPELRLRPPPPKPEAQAQAPQETEAPQDTEAPKEKSRRMELPAELAPVNEAMEDGLNAIAKHLQSTQAAISRLAARIPGLSAALAGQLSETLTRWHDAAHGMSVEVRRAKFHSLCPWCRGDTKAAECRGCKDIKLVTRERYEQAPPDLRGEQQTVKSILGALK